uniref:Uncharacterized protein n=1 Tax=Trichinella nativa TaxID=6335 RepID=A0A0V1KIW1_9BILA
MTVSDFLRQWDDCSGMTVSDFLRQGDDCESFSEAGG